ncbi:MAG: hypothetical protein E7325_09625 [Clostridiales bacterium]|nr:hypothetical protein [Clostridiales bacterium]
MMMNRFKRFLSLICALSMLISIAGSYADPNEGDRPDLPAATEPASEPEPAPAEEPPQESEADEANETNDPEGDDPSDTDPSDEDPSDEEPSGQEEPSGSEESSEDDSQPGGEPASDQQKEHSDEEKPSEEEKPSADERKDPKPDDSKNDESQPDGAKQEDENQTPASEGEEKQASGSGNGENRESSDQTGTDHPSDADSAATQTAGQETSGSSDGSGTAEQGNPAENEAENKDAQASEQNVSDQNASSQNGSDQNPSSQNTLGQESAVQEMPSDSDENLNEAEEPKDDPEEKENEEDQTGLNVLEIGGSVKKGTVVPDEPVRLVMRSERTETILLTVILAAEDEIRLAVNSRELSFAESTVDEENGEQTLIYPLEAKDGNAYLLEITADKETGFSIQAAYREAEVPKEEELPEGEENKEQTEVQNDNNPDDYVEKPAESENSKDTNNQEPQEPDKKEESSNIPELSIPENASITYDVFWDGEAAIGEVAHFVAVVTGMEGYNYQLQWQASDDNEKWFDLDNETGMKMDVLITNENCDLYWRVQMKVTGMIHSEKEIDSNLNEESDDNHDAGMSNDGILDEHIPNEEKSDEKTETEVN